MVDEFFKSLYTTHTILSTHIYPANSGDLHEILIFLLSYQDIFECLKKLNLEWIKEQIKYLTVSLDTRYILKLYPKSHISLKMIITGQPAKSY